MSRTSFYLGIVLQRQGEERKSTVLFQNADKLRREVLGDEYFDSKDEEAYDQLVSLWAR